MTKIIEGELILTENTEFSESIEVKGNIKGYSNLKVAGNINAWDINAGNINAWNIIFCNKIKVKKGCKVFCKALIKDRLNLERKEFETGDEK